MWYYTILNLRQLFFLWFFFLLKIKSKRTCKIIQVYVFLSPKIQAKQNIIIHIIWNLVKIEVLLCQHISHTYIYDNQNKSNLFIIYVINWTNVHVLLLSEELLPLSFLQLCQAYNTFRQSFHYRQKAEQFISDQKKHEYLTNLPFFTYF